MKSLLKQDVYSILSQTQSLRVSDGETVSVLSGCESATRLLVIIWGQLGDFDNLEYAWWLRRESKKLQAKEVTIRAIGIGDRNSGQKFCQYTGFPEAWLYVEPATEIHNWLCRKE